MDKKQLITSEITIYEYAFVAKKHKENPQDIQKYLQFLSKFTKQSKNSYLRTLEIMAQKDFYRHSFDAFHIAFAQYYQCQKFITFDQGFKKLQDITDMEIVIL
ncbi:MAG: hypothetical protein KU28_12495 [Sulfurovum sp. PC08-66]|nr:MAG: hypothetical protein KU28_12495 [Sulfurovum sp. PC08-66]